MARIAIIGSRFYPDLDQVTRFVVSLPPDTVVISGACPIGVDKIAAQTARKCKFTLEEYPANWKEYGKSAGPRRNTTIVQKSDRVVAFWDGTSNGTKDVITKATELGKPLDVFILRETEITECPTCGWLIRYQEKGTYVNGSIEWSGLERATCCVTVYRDEFGLTWTES